MPNLNNSSQNKFYMHVFFKFVMLKKVLANRRSQSLIVSTASDPAILDSSKSKIKKNYMSPKIESHADGTGKPFTSCLSAGKVMKKRLWKSFYYCTLRATTMKNGLLHGRFFMILPTGLFDSLNEKVKFKPLHCKADMIYNKAYFKVHGKR